MRLIDANFRRFTEAVGFPILIKNGLTYDTWNKPYDYNQNIRDTFLDYKFDGFENIEIPMNFGTTNKPDNHIIYYEPKKIGSRRIILFFPVLKQSKEIKIFYGDKLFFKTTV